MYISVILTLVCNNNILCRRSPVGTAHNEVFAIGDVTCNLSNSKALCRSSVCPSRWAPLWSDGNTRETVTGWTRGGGGPALNCGTYASLMVLKYFQAFETHPPLVCILVYMVLKYFPQCYTHPPLAGILVYTVLKWNLTKETPPTPCVGTKV